MRGEDTFNSWEGEIELLIFMALGEQRKGFEKSVKAKCEVLKLDHFVSKFSFKVGERIDIGTVTYLPGVDRRLSPP